MRKAAPTSALRRDAVRARSPALPGSAGAAATRSAWGAFGVGGGALSDSGTAGGVLGGVVRGED
ncbi:MAG TPA: hypothetical protein VFV33_15110, partial [Gemmatimonadaceae bacterium]|nr:hypothetical protein [Gemmatimonadaceae bacterium]